MPKSKSHMSHSFLGEEEARPLVEWMNRVGKKRRKPVEDLLKRLLRVMIGPQEQEIDRADKQPYLAVVRNRMPYAQAVKDLQRELKRLHRWPELTLVRSPEARVYFRWTSGDETVNAKLSLVELAAMDLAWRLRPCKLASCGKWFFAKFKHQWSCCPAHQQSFYRQSNEWKEHRRKWSKEYRKVKASGLVK